MINTDSNCPGRAQGTALDTFAQLRNEVQLQALLKDVDTFFQDFGLGRPVEVLDDLIVAVTPDYDGEPEPIAWSAQWVADHQFYVGKIIVLLAKMYEARRTHLYKSAGV